MSLARSPGYLLVDQDGCPELPVLLKKVREFARQVIWIGLAAPCLYRKT